MMYWFCSSTSVTGSSGLKRGLLLKYRVTLNNKHNTIRYGLLLIALVGYNY